MPIDVLKCTRELVAADTTPARGTAAAMPVLVAMCKQVGMRPRVIEGTIGGSTQAALIATKGPALVAGGLMCVAHLDTAHPGDAARWPGGDPWCLQAVDDGTLTGLGAADAKGALAAMVRAIGDLAGVQFARCLSLVATFDGLGRRSGLPFVLESWEDAPLPHHAVVAAPTGLARARSHAGWTVLRVEVRALGTPPPAAGGAARVVATGRSVHACDPGRGRSAILRLLRYLEAASLQGSSPVTLAIDGGHRAGAVPDACEAVVVFGDATPAPAPQIEVRPLAGFSPGPSLDRPLLGVRRLLDDLSADPAIHSVNLGRLTGGGEVVVAELGLVPAAGTRAAVDVACRTAARVGTATPGLELEAEVRGAWEPLDGGPPRLAFATEAPVLAARGTDVTICGPGDRPGCDGRPGESLPVAQLQEAVAAYRSAIAAICVR